MKIFILIFLILIMKTTLSQTNISLDSISKNISDTVSIKELIVPETNKLIEYKKNKKIHSTFFGEINQVNYFNKNKIIKNKYFFKKKYLLNNFQEIDFFSSKDYSLSFFYYLSKKYSSKSDDTSSTISLVPGGPQDCFFYNSNEYKILFSLEIFPIFKGENELKITNDNLKGFVIFDKNFNPLSAYYKNQYEEYSYLNFITNLKKVNIKFSELSKIDLRESVQEIKYSRKNITFLTTNLISNWINTLQILNQSSTSSNFP